MGKSFPKTLASILRFKIAWHDFWRLYYLGKSGDHTVGYLKAIQARSAHEAERAKDAGL